MSPFILYLRDSVATWETVILFNSEKKTTQKLHVNYDSGNVKTNKQIKHTHTHTRKIGLEENKPNN